eukprot:SAG11_NODE_3783_length_2229_cov_1.594366_3_plen_83_part_00
MAWQHCPPASLTTESLDVLVRDSAASPRPEIACIQCWAVQPCPAGAATGTHVNSTRSPPAFPSAAMTLALSTTAVPLTRMIL